MVVKATVTEVATNCTVKLNVGDVVAIKKVLQDRKYKNRELSIMSTLSHPNVVTLADSFFTNGKGDQYLNLVLEYIPETVYHITRSYARNKEKMPLVLVKIYTYQLLRSLAYIHSQGVCHRDIKPQNLLVDPKPAILKLCDFGSAKMLIKGEPNVAYICSRYYRAPELMFGATEYTTAIDCWSAGCVCAELMLGRPLFAGRKGVEQLVEIMKVLGTPTPEQILIMNPQNTQQDFPKIKQRPWRRIIKSAPPDALDLIDKLLRYLPEERLLAEEACTHPFFDELRDPATRLPTGEPLPPLFNWTPAETYFRDLMEE